MAAKTIRPAATANGLAYFQDATMVDGNNLQSTTSVIHESDEWVTA